MKNEIIELTDSELSHINGGDSTSWLAVGGLALVIGVGILTAPVAGAAFVAWSAFSLAMAGDAAIGYGMATMS